MKPLPCLAIAFALVCHAPPPLFSQVELPTRNAAQEAVQHELSTVSKARAAVRRGDDADADAQLIVTGKGRWAHKPSSVALARRAAVVCGELQNENEYGRAAALAERVVRQLARMEETNDAERAERLFWEAWLESEVLGNRDRAISLLAGAEKLAPQDERIIDLALRLVSAATPWP